MLYLVDPHRSWWLGGDAGAMAERYTARLRAITERYSRVVMIGDSMGATGCLLFAPLATSVLAFCPQVRGPRRTSRRGRVAGGWRATGGWHMGCASAAGGASGQASCRVAGSVLIRREGMGQAGHCWTAAAAGQLLGRRAPPPHAGQRHPAVQVDLSTASIRPAESGEWLDRLKQHLMASVQQAGAAGTRIKLFSGTWQHDLDQVNHLAQCPGVVVKVGQPAVQAGTQLVAWRVACTLLPPCRLVGEQGDPSGRLARRCLQRNAAVTLNLGPCPAGVL